MWSKISLGKQEASLSFIISGANGLYFYYSQFPSTKRQSATWKQKHSRQWIKMLQRRVNCHKLLTLHLHTMVTLGDSCCMYGKWQVMHSVPFYIRIDEETSRLLSLDWLNHLTMPNYKKYWIYCDILEIGRKPSYSYWNWNIDDLMTGSRRNREEMLMLKKLWYIFLYPPWTL